MVLLAEVASDLEGHRSCYLKQKPLGGVCEAQFAPVLGALTDLLPQQLWQINEPKLHRKFILGADPRRRSRMKAKSKAIASPRRTTSLPSHATTMELILLLAPRNGLLAGLDEKQVPKSGSESHALHHVSCSLPFTPRGRGRPELRFVKEDRRKLCRAGQADVTHP